MENESRLIRNNSTYLRRTKDAELVHEFGFRGLKVIVFIEIFKTKDGKFIAEGEIVPHHYPGTHGFIHDRAIKFDMSMLKDNGINFFETEHYIRNFQRIYKEMIEIRPYIFKIYDIFGITNNFEDDSIIEYEKYYDEHGYYESEFKHGNIRLGEEKNKKDLELAHQAEEADSLFIDKEEGEKKFIEQVFNPMLMRAKRDYEKAK